MPTFNTFHYQNPKTLTAFRVTLPPADARVGILTGVSEYDYVFSYPATYTYKTIDIRGVHHRQIADGNLIQTEPKFITRWSIKWTVATVADVVGGAVDDIKDIEFLTYLENHKHEFTVGGVSGLQMILNYDNTLTWDEQNEVAFEVRLIQLSGISNVGTDMMEAMAIFETASSTSSRPYTIVSNRDVTL